MRIGPNVYLRTDGRWEARYQKAVDDKGRTVYGYVYGKTQEEAEKKRSEKLMEFDKAQSSISPLASHNPKISVIPNAGKNKNKTDIRKEKFAPAYNHKTMEMIYSDLIQSKTTESFAFLLCLLLGLSKEEIIALRFCDIDLCSKQINIRQIAESENRKYIIVHTSGRTIPMTKRAISLCNEWKIQQRNGDFYVLTDSLEFAENSRKIESSFRNLVNMDFKDTELSISSLRSTFIRTCLEANLNIETVSALTGADKESLYRYFGMYIKANPKDIKRLDELQSNSCNQTRHLNLLILGAGSHGHGVKEIAEQLGVFHMIKFLDDNVQSDEVIGKCSDYLQFADEYPAAFPAIGDNELREKWTNDLQQAGFILPLLIHPSAIVSDNVTFDDGTVVMSQATVNAGAKIGKACIIAPNSMVGFGSEIGAYSHVECGSIVAKSAKVPEMTVVKSGEVYQSELD